MPPFELSSLLPTDLQKKRCVIVVDNAAGHAKRLRSARPRKDDSRFQAETKESSRTLSPVPGRTHKWSIGPCHSPTSLADEFQRQYIGKQPQPTLRTSIKSKFEASPASSRNAPKPVRQASVESLQCNMTLIDASIAALRLSSSSPKKGTIASLRDSLPTIEL